MRAPSWLVVVGLFLIVLGLALWIVAKVTG